MLAAAALLLGLVVAMLAAAAVGQWENPRSGEGPTITATPSPEGPSMDFTPPELPTIDPIAGGERLAENPWVRGVVIAIVAIIGLVVLFLLLRLLASVLRREPPTTPDPRMVTTAGVDDAIEAPAILDGIARAQDALEGDRPPRDAIIQAWLALEHAATNAGVGRTPAQTPTEFTAVVLERTPADRASVDVLRGLYTRVRFSDDELQRGDAEAAREALTAIAASWSEIEVPS